MKWYHPFIVFILILVAFFMVGASILEIGHKFPHVGSSSQHLDIHARTFSVRYPDTLGDFYFFKRQGELYYPSIHGPKGRSIVVASVLKVHPIDKQKVWFIADYKVDPRIRNMKLGAIFLSSMLPWGWMKCPRMYSLVMHRNIKDAKYLKWWNKLLRTFKISFYLMESLNSVSMIPRYSSTSLHVVSSKFTKEILIDGVPQKIYHIASENEPYSTKLSELELSSDAYIMIWLSEDEKRSIATSKLPKAWVEGMIVHHGMPSDEDFSWLSTLDL